jgi:ankyrin repeat protein
MVRRPSHRNDTPPPLLPVRSLTSLPPADDWDARLRQAAHAGDCEAIAAAFAHGAHADAFAGRSDTPLIIASYNGHVDAVRALLAAGAGVNVTNSWGETPLRYAAAYGQPAILHLLLAAGAAVNRVTTHDGKTALQRAVSKGHDAIVEALLVAGACTEVPTRGGRSLQSLVRAKGGGGLRTYRTSRRPLPLASQVGSDMMVAHRTVCARITSLLDHFSPWGRRRHAVVACWEGVGDD